MRSHHFEDEGDGGGLHSLRLENFVGGFGVAVCGSPHFVRLRKGQDEGRGYGD